MEPEYARQYQRLYQQHWWWRAREAVILEELRRLISPASRPRILDVGCGAGLFFDRLSEWGEVYGVESDAQIVAMAGRHASRIRHAAVDGNFALDETFDVILLLDVLEHLPDPIECLRAIGRHLTPGGQILLTLPAFRCLWTSHDRLNHHRTRYTKRALCQEAAAADLEVIRQFYFFHWMFAAKMAVRIKESFAKPQPKSPAVPLTIVNRALLWGCQIERATYGRLPLPFGGSLLGVLRHLK